MTNPWHRFTAWFGRSRTIESAEDRAHRAQIGRSGDERLNELRPRYNQAVARARNTADIFSDMSLVSTFLGWVIGVGLVLCTLFAIAKEGSGFPASCLWALAMLAFGAALGFLFGIPKVLQGSNTGPAESSAPAGPPATTRNNVTGATAPAASTPFTYQQRVNTNLEEISDWLTKIIVGVGLIQLQNIPGFLSRLSVRISATNPSFRARDDYLLLDRRIPVRIPPDPSVHPGSFTTCRGEQPERGRGSASASCPPSGSDRGCS